MTDIKLEIQSSRLGSKTKLAKKDAKNEPNKRTGSSRTTKKASGS